jgi:hypothetical protein
MPDPTTEQEALFRYRTDPKFAVIMDTLAHHAVPKDAPDAKIRFFAALDFFLIGVAMVVNPDEVDRPNCDPSMFEFLPDGRAKYTRPVPAHIIQQHGEPILEPDEFVLLKMENRLELPHVDENNQVVGWEPWIESWRKAESALDAFLVR